MRPAHRLLPRSAIDTRLPCAHNSRYPARLNCVVQMPKRAKRTSALADIVAQFGANVTPKLRAGVGHGEAQLRDPFASLLKDAGIAIGLEILTIDETPLNALGIRPDFMVNVAGAKVGFVELKARGRGVPTTWTPTTREREQWDKLRLLPNVLYSDGEQYAVYHFGVLSGTVAQLVGDLRTAGSALRPVDGQFERVISEFLLWEPEPPRSVGQLVHAVANLCRLLRDEVRATLHREQRGKNGNRSSHSWPQTGESICSPICWTRTSLTPTRKRSPLRCCSLARTGSRSRRMNYLRSPANWADGTR